MLPALALDLLEARLALLKCGGVTQITSRRLELRGFHPEPGERLRPLAGPTVALADDARPGDVLFNPIGTNLVGVRVNTSQIDSLGVGPA